MQPLMPAGREISAFLELLAERPDAVPRHFQPDTPDRLPVCGSAVSGQPFIDAKDWGLVTCELCEAWRSSLNNESLEMLAVLRQIIARDKVGARRLALTIVARVDAAGLAASNRRRQAIAETIVRNTTKGRK